MSWPAAHGAFAAADPVLDQGPAPVVHLGIGERRRGRPRWQIDERTGAYLLLAGRWHACLFGLSGDQGLLGQVAGRAAGDAAYWLAQAAPAWRDAVRVVAIGMCSVYACAVRRVLPGAQIAVDVFRVVHLAVKMTGGVRRRVVRGTYGRRGRSGDPEYGTRPASAGRVRISCTRGTRRRSRDTRRQEDTPGNQTATRPRFASQSRISGSMFLG